MSKTRRSTLKLGQSLWRSLRICLIVAITFGFVLVSLVISISIISPNHDEHVVELTPFQNNNSTTTKTTSNNNFNPDRNINRGATKRPRPVSLEFSKDFPTGISSKKPTSFFRNIQQQIDGEDPYKRCQRYGYAYRPDATVLHVDNNPHNNNTQKSRRRRLFYGSLIAEEPWELLEIVAAEAYGIYAGMVFVEGNRTQNFDPRPVRRANNPQHIQQLQHLFGTPQIQVRLYSNEKPQFRGIRREHAQRQEILRGWRELGMTQNDVGILADADETFSRDFLRAAQDCDVPNFEYHAHQCFTSKVKLSSSSRVYETSPECVTDVRAWYKTAMVIGSCIEMIGNRSIHPLAFRDGPRRAHGFGRACTQDFSKITGKHPLFSASDFRMLCGAAPRVRDVDGTGQWSNYTGYHFHNFFTNFNATRLKYNTYGHAVGAKRAFTAALTDLGQNDLKLMYRCVREIPDDPNEKWKRIIGGLNASGLPLPIYFHDADYVRERHEWVQEQVRLDDQMAEILRRQWNESMLSFQPTNK